MADYIDGEYIADLPDKELLDDSDLLVVEDSEATKKTTFDKLKSSFDSIKEFTPYFAVSENASYRPSHGETSSVLGEAILGTIVLGDSGRWETDIPVTSDSQCLWVSFYVEYLDGTTEWLAEFMAMDKNAKDTIAELEAFKESTDESVKNLTEQVKEYEEKIPTLEKDIQDLQEDKSNKIVVSSKSMSLTVKAGSSSTAMTPYDSPYDSYNKIAIMDVLCDSPEIAIISTNLSDDYMEVVCKNPTDEDIAVTLSCKVLYEVQ